MSRCGGALKMCLDEVCLDHCAFLIWNASSSARYRCSFRLFSSLEVLNRNGGRFSIGPKGVAGVRQDMAEFSICCCCFGMTLILFPCHYGSRFRIEPNEVASSSFLCFLFPPQKKVVKGLLLYISIIVYYYLFVQHFHFFKIMYNKVMFKNAKNLCQKLTSKK